MADSTDASDPPIDGPTPEPGAPLPAGTSGEGPPRRRTVPPVSRRAFLTGLGATGAAAATGVYLLGRGGDRGHDHAHAGHDATSGSGSPVGDRRLVVIFLDGGNDALNTVVPVGDPAYASLRGDLAIDPATTLDIGEGYALHPSLAGFKRLWDGGRAAVVHGVGFAGLDRSHFHCRDVWHAADEHDLSTGWLGRWLDAVGTSPLDAVVVGNRLPLALRGSRRSGAVVPAGPFVLPGDARTRQGLTTLADADDDVPELLAAVASSTSDLLEVVDRIPPPGSARVDDERAAAGGALTSKVDAVARIIGAGLPTRVFALDLGGFDTHAAQAATHRDLLLEVDAAVERLLGAVSVPTTVAVYSEFGRRVRPNASVGTDHGSGGTILLAGAIKPGHHGDPPPLTDLDQGDLRATVDFRSIYAALCGEILGLDPDDLMEHAPAPLAIV